ncbi:MAG: exodeoxyribonuclease VII large subunit [Cycloclasticus sp. symbiont of Poecilosclerida sp. M]|nr:MAG: exodeoxyribonuclease VII large subunit [Cycloclasticus sp. symbiont of Poecilosclerida sp. M]
MNENEYIYSVSQLCRETRLILEGHFLNLTIEGEISNLSRPASGHIYFTLKDDKAQVQCAMFRPQLRKIGFKPENNQHVLLKARVSLYEARGNFQLIVERIEPLGEGALRQKFDALKQMLLTEGLFEAERKKALPALAKKIGVITSQSGAAIHDILTVLKKRFASIPVLIYPVSVQGDAAKNEICAAIQLANERSDCDVLLLARGGGSLEDLWSFNEESVARAIYASSLPIVSAIGHEVDFTIADFVADARAATPSAAAEMLSPDQQHWFAHLEHLTNKLGQSAARSRQHKQQQLNSLSALLKQLHPCRQLEMHQQRLDDCYARLLQAPGKYLQRARLNIAQLSTELLHHNPIHRIKSHQKIFASHQNNLTINIQKKVYQSRLRFANCTKALELLNPLATLSRGYSVTKKIADDTIIHSTQQVNLGDKLHIQLQDGSLQTTLDKIDET